ncbi:uncharacterized protein METZ01_LOCUS250783, partial [marine metagenome]
VNAPVRVDYPPSDYTERLQSPHGAALSTEQRP